MTDNMAADRTCERHPGVTLLPDTFGHWYCPSCDDEAHAALIDKGVPAAGGPVSGSALPLTEPGYPSCVVPSRSREALGANFMAMLNAGADADFRRREESLRAALVERVERALNGVLAGPDYGDASGHLGGDGITALAEAAVAEFEASVRGGITQIRIALDPGQPQVRPGVLIVDGVQYVPKEPHPPTLPLDHEPTSGITTHLVDRINEHLAEHGFTPDGEAP